MRDQKLVNALREHAEWAELNQWETPITLCDDLAEDAETTRWPMRGPVTDVVGGGKRWML